MVLGHFMHTKTFPKKTHPHFKAFKYDLEVENSVYWVKNIERMGKITYKFKITPNNEEKGYFAKFQTGRGASFLRGEFACARVNLMATSLPKSTNTCIC